MKAHNCKLHHNNANTTNMTRKETRRYDYLYDRCRPHHIFIRIIFLPHLSSLDSNINGKVQYVTDVKYHVVSVETIVSSFCRTSCVNEGTKLPDVASTRTMCSGFLVLSRTFGN